MPFLRLLSAHLPTLSLAAVTLAIGCHAQEPKPGAAGPSVTQQAAVVANSGTPVPLDIRRRVEVILRQKANLPPGSTVVVSGRSPSELNGYDDITVVVANDESLSKPIHFLLSKDGKTMAQFNKFDIAEDPKLLVSPAGRPSRGGPASAPVTIVGFDDLECPFCAKMHATLFPAITQRYGDKVHIVYKDFPLTDIHPWAMRASVDTNCLGAQSGDAYWKAVDYMHAHAGEFGADPANAKAEKTLPRAQEQLDKATRELGKADHLDAAKIDACIAKQDTAAIDASRAVGEKLGIAATPTLFINGDKIDGAVPLEFVFGIIDDALRAEGVTPPPPYAAPAPKPATTAPAKAGQ